MCYNWVTGLRCQYKVAGGIRFYRLPSFRQNVYRPSPLQWEDWADSCVSGSYMERECPLNRMYFNISHLSFTTFLITYLHAYPHFHYTTGRRRNYLARPGTIACTAIQRIYTAAHPDNPSGQQHSDSVPCRTTHHAPRLLLIQFHPRSAHSFHLCLCCCTHTQTQASFPANLPLHQSASYQLLLYHRKHHPHPPGRTHT